MRLRTILSFIRCKSTETAPLAWRCFLSLTCMLLVGFLFGVHRYVWVDDDTVCHVVHQFHIIKTPIALLVGGIVGYWLSILIYKNTIEVKLLKKVGRAGLMVEIILLLLAGLALAGLVAYENRPVPKGATLDVLESLQRATLLSVDPKITPGDLENMNMFSKKASHYFFLSMIPKICYRKIGDAYHFYDEWGGEIHIEKKDEKYFFVSNGPNKVYDNMSGDDLFVSIDFEHPFEEDE